MKHNLGISVYPDISDIADIKKYIKLASKYGFKRIFSSMFSVKGSKEEVLNYFKDLIYYAHKYDMQVALDVNPDLFKRLGASIEDLSVFKDIDVDILRMDLSYGGEKDYILVNNPYGIKIEFNSSEKIVEGLLKAGAKKDDFLICHNFYPQRYTGLSWDGFLEKNKKIKSLANVKIGAFVSSNNNPTHGVWDAKYGLPTVERLRDLDIGLQSRILLASGMVDDILIGNAYASENELRTLSETIEGYELKKDMPIINMLVEHGILNLDYPRIIKINPDISDDISNVEREIIFNFEPHLALGDNSEFIWRSRMSRFNPDLSIKPRENEKKTFLPGDIVIVNDNYKHYAGEVQIVLKDIENDGQRNYIGKIKNDEILLMDFLEGTSIVKFIE